MFIRQNWLSFDLDFVRNTKQLCLLKQSFHRMVKRVIKWKFTIVLHILLSHWQWQWYYADLCLHILLQFSFVHSVNWTFDFRLEQFWRRRKNERKFHKMFYFCSKWNSFGFCEFWQFLFLSHFLARSNFAINRIKLYHVVVQDLHKLHVNTHHVMRQQFNIEK